MKRKAFTCILIGFLAIWSVANLTAQARVAEPPDRPIELRYAHSNVPIYFYHTAGQAYATEVLRATNGTVRINLFPQGQLGGERDVTEGLQLGTIDLQATSIGVTGTFVPSIQILNLPFLFNGPRHWMAVMNGPIGRELLERAQREGDAVGLKVLAIAAPDFRIPMNNVRPINRIEDFRGLKMRTMQVPVHIEAYRAIGASPVPLPFGELYAALQTGVVDGNENGPLALFGNRFYEVQRFLTLLPVVSNGGIFLMSERTFDRLSPRQQTAMLRAVDVWRQTMDRDALEQGGVAIEQMRARGVTVTSIADLTPFTAVMGPVYDNFFRNLAPAQAEWARGMVGRIREASRGIEEGDWFAKR